MNSKILSAVIVLISFSVESMETAIADAETFASYFSLRKPSEIPAMLWLQDLERKRDEIPYYTGIEAYKAYRAVTREISATLGGKYGISSVPATPLQQQIILDSIDKTRLFFMAQPNMITTMYLSYGEPVAREKELTESRLKHLAKATGTNWEVFQRHLAAISMADGISWVYKRVRDAPFGSLQPEHLLQDIQSLHTKEHHQNLRRLISPLSPQLRDDMMQMIQKIGRNERCRFPNCLGSPDFHEFVIEERQVEVGRVFSQIMKAPKLEEEEPLLVLKLSDWIMYVQSDFSLALVFARQGEWFTSQFWQEKFEKKTDIGPIGNLDAHLLKALKLLIPNGVLEGRDFLTQLEREYAAFSADFFKRVQGAIKVLQAVWLKKVPSKEELDQYPEKFTQPEEVPDVLRKLAYHYLEGILNADDEVVDQLRFTASIAELLKEEELAVKIWKKNINHPKANIKDWHYSILDLATLGRRDLFQEASDNRWAYVAKINH